MLREFEHPWPHDETHIKKILVPHPWDMWERGYRPRDTEAPVKSISEEVDPNKKLVKPKTGKRPANSLLTTNVLGEQLTLLDVHRYYTKGDWTTKVHTPECTQCPFFVEKIKLPNALLTDKLGDTNPNLVTGLCLYGFSGGNHLRKFLLNRNSNAGCPIPLYDRQEQEQKKRAAGGLFS